MKTILQKDLRENFKLALIGAAIFTLMLIIAYHNSVKDLDTVLINGVGTSVSALNPLISDNAIGFASFFCAIYGAMLGWLQTRNEAHRDLWAFLIHRPVTRTQIYQGKVLAGLMLYGLGAGLPLAVLMLVCITPGHFPMPFEGAMLLPLTATFLAGVAYYFAGVLTGLRQARWYGSRGFGLGCAFFASFFMFKFGEFWQSCLGMAIVTGVLATAVWGAYQSGGFFRGQPRAGQSALSLTMAAGGGIVVVIVAGLFLTLVLDRLMVDSAPSTGYTMLRTGEIVKQTWQAGEWKSAQDLAGKPFRDPQTGALMNQNQTASLQAAAFSFNANRPWLAANASYNNYLTSYRYFSLWNVADKKLWYIDRHGRLLGYDGITKRFIGEIRASDAGGVDTGVFKRPDANYGADFYYRNADGELKEALVTSNAVYWVDPGGPSIKRIFTVAAGDSIAGYSETTGFNKSILVATHKTIQMMDTNGTILFQTAYALPIGDYPSVSLYYLEKDQRAVWFNPIDFKSPAHVVWTDSGGTVSKSQDLPSLLKPYPEQMAPKIVSALVPPGVFLGGFLLYAHKFASFIHSVTRFEFLMSCGCSVACVLIGLGAMNKYHFAGAAKVRWCVFIFLLGIPGLLGLWVTEEWPVREVCPKCQRLRAVDREHCEYCDAEFPAPEKNGTEIFEPLGAVTK